MQLMAYNAVIIYYDIYTIRANSIMISTIDKNYFHSILCNASQLILPFFLSDQFFVHCGALLKDSRKKHLLTALHMESLVHDKLHI